MPIRVENTFNAQTPYGQGLQSIAAAMFAAPTAAERATAEARTRFMDAQTQQMASAAAAKEEEANQTARANDAWGNIAAAIEQAQMLQAESMGADDPGLQTVLASLPMTGAKYGAGANLDPKTVAQYMQMAMSQFGSEDMIRRNLPSLGMAPNQNTAITEGRADQMRTEDQANSIAKVIANANAQAEGSIAVNDAKMIPVLDGSRYINMPAGETMGMQVAPPRTTQQKPLVIRPKDVEAIQDLIRAAAGDSAAFPLQGDVESQLIGRASSLYTAPGSPYYGNMGGAVDAARAEMFPNGFEQVGNWNPFVANETVPVETGAAPAPVPQAQQPMDAMPDPAQHKGRTIKDQDTGVRYISNGSQWVVIS